MTKALKKIKETAGNIHTSINRRRKPKLKFPIRSLSNVQYKPRIGYFEIGNKVKERTMSYNTVKAFSQTLKMMSVSKDLIESNDHASKREMYYISKNWDEARFEEQPESDAVMDDIEAMFAVNREQLKFFPDEKGGEIAGKLTVIDKDRQTGKPIKIDCMKFGSGAYSIPTSVEDLKFQTSAKFILVIETASMFQRLVNHSYWKKANCILISMGGVPSRACRRFIRRLSDDKTLPVYVFTDGDPYGYANIYRTLKVGSGNAAHINKYFCVPRARFLGVTPQDIVDYKLPTHPLKEVDVKRAKDMIKNDPFFQSHKDWKKQVELMIKLGKRAEQQAFAAAGLNYVIEKYLPKKIKNSSNFLP